MPTTNDIIADMRNALRVSDPDLDTTAGSTTRKILDVVAEVVSEAYADQHLLEYHYDVDSKSGSDLDDLVALFGFSRFAERRATGVVTFERQIPATEDIFISPGTIVANQTTPLITFATVTPAVLRQGDTSVSVPVRAVEGGARGNVAAGTVVQRLTGLSGISGVTNLNAMVGGQDAESDLSLRKRFKSTVFRNLAGTEAMYAGIALDDVDTITANVIGVTKRFREQVDISGGTGSVTVPDARFVHEGTAVFGSNLDAGNLLIEGVHFNLTSTQNGINFDIAIAEIGSGVPDGIYELSIAYIPNASRNDPANGITNRVDVYVHGQRAEEATDTVVFQETVQFVNDPTSPLHFANFERRTGLSPGVGNRFVRLSQSPILLGANANSEITIPNDVDPQFVEGVDFWYVNDITNEGMAPRRYAGIEFVNAELPKLANDLTDTVFSLTYIFNALPRSVQEAIEQWRLLTTDVLVHQAKIINLKMNFVVVLSPGGSNTPVEDEVASAVERVVTRVGFNNILQSSDILEAAAQIEGVDAIRFATSTDDLNEYAIERLGPDGSPLSPRVRYETSGRATDVVTDDDEVAVLHSVNLTFRARNTFHVGH